MFDTVASISLALLALGVTVANLVIASAVHTLAIKTAQLYDSAREVDVVFEPEPKRRGLN